MAERPIWRGHLRLALVSCPVALYSAHHDRGNLRFNYINPKTGNRVRMITQDAETGDELSRGELVKGYQFKKDHYLVLSEEDFESARVPSSSTMTIEKFVPGDSIDPIYFDSSYYLVPDGEAGQDVYVVLREAINQTGRLALTRVVISRRERVIAMMPMGHGLVAHTLHEERDLNNPKALFDRVPEIKPDPEMVQLAVQLIDRQTGRYDPSDVEDRYEARLREIIDAKLKGEGISPEQEEEPDRGNVIDLMAALKRSLGQSVEQKEDKKPASRTRAAASGSTPAKKGESAKRESASAKKPARKRA
jgi:DNA end-binding protein Ku